MANDFSKFTYGGTTYDIKDAVARNNSIEFISGTVGSTPQKWLGTTVETSLVNGKTILYRVPNDVPSSTLAITLNLTYAGGGTSGEKTLYKTTGYSYSPYRAGTILLLVYYGSAWRIAQTVAITQDLMRPTRLNGVNDPTLQGVINNTRANHWAFLPASQIIIEQTVDGGTTWTDAGISDGNKTALFSETRPTVYIPLVGGVKSLLGGIRVTFTAMKYNVPDGTAETAKYNYWNTDYVTAQERYCNIKDIYFWVSANSDTIGVKVEAAKPTTSTTWTTLFDSGTTWGMTGWSGNDYISFGQNVFGGSTNQTSQYWNWRLTFMTRGVNGSDTLSGTNTTSRQAIQEIRGYGDSVWGAPNSYMMRDHLYNWDVNQNVTFPAAVNAPQHGATTMTGTLTSSANKYYEANNASGIDMKNSDIISVNSIYTADSSDNATEGISFYRDSTHYDTLWVNAGDILFVPNRTKGTQTSKANSQKVARFTTNPTTSQVVMTDGTTGGVVSQAILPVVNGGTGVDALDEDLSMDSINPIQNQAIANAVSNLQQELATTTATLEDAIAQINETLGNQDGTLTQALNNINSVAVTATELINALRTINEELTRQIEEYAGMIETYLWVQSINGVVNVFKGIKNGSVQDRQTADQWAILQNGGEVIKVENGQATVNTVTVQNSLNLGKYTLTVDADGSWSIT